jgi:hypothetical protein
VRSNTTGIFGTGPEAWKSCAKSGEAPLKVSTVDDLLDKQSVLNAKTNFSVEVEEWMRRNCLLSWICKYHINNKELVFGL